MSDMLNKKKNEFDCEQYDSIRLLFSAESGALIMTFINSLELNCEK
jgi:hypothetical protein